LGIYFFDAALTNVKPAPNLCDAGGNGAGGHPESCSITLTPGTYYFAAVTFAVFYPPPDNVDPTAFTVTIGTSP
jgi:hypothetical protein